MVTVNSAYYMQLKHYTCTTVMQIIDVHSMTIGAIAVYIKINATEWR